MICKKGITGIICLFVVSTSFGQQSTSELAREQARELQRRQIQLEADKRYQESQKKSSSSGYSNTKETLTSEAIATIEDKTPDQNRLRKIKIIAVSDIGYKTNLWGLIDQYGREIVPPKYLDISFASLNSYAVFGYKDGSGRHPAWGFIDSDGKVIVPLVYDKILSGFVEGNAMVVLNNEKFLVNKSGNVVGSKTVYVTAAEVDEKEVAQIASRNAIDEKNYSLGKQKQAMGELKVALGFYNQIFNYTDNYLGNWLERKQMRVDLLLRKAICILNEGTSSNGRIADAMHYLIEYQTAGGTDPKQYFYTGLAIKFYSGEFYDYPEFVKFSDALPYFKEYETKETIALQEETKLFFYSAESYTARGDYKNALLYYLKYNTLKKGNDGLTLFRIIQCYLDLNDFTNATAYIYHLKDPIFNGVILTYTDTYLGVAYNYISESYLKKADFANALLYSDSTLNYFAKFKRTSTGEEVILRSSLQYKLGRYDEALAGFNDVLDSSSSGNYEIRYLRGILNSRLGKNQLACSDWSEAKNNFNGKSNSLSKVQLFVTMIQIDSALSTCTPKMLKPIKGYKYYSKYPPSKD